MKYSALLSGLALCVGFALSHFTTSAFAKPTGGEQAPRKTVNHTNDHAEPKTHAQLYWAKISKQNGSGKVCVCQEGKYSGYTGFTSSQLSTRDDGKEHYMRYNCAYKVFAANGNPRSGGSCGNFTVL